ncbi:MAG: hypothetical protein PHF51_01455 [Candidatus ainarchaeum sp.]|nr:hypothetical protein [Candidatus ainarchaeum sp.]
MDEKLKPLFAKARVVYSKEEFQLVGLPGAANVSIGGEGFSAVVKEKGETTLILPTEKWHELEPQLKNVKIKGPYKVVTLEMPELRETPGVLSEIASIFSREGVASAPVSSFGNNHFLVRAGDAGKAIRGIERAILGCKEAKAGEKE